MHFCTETKNNFVIFLAAQRNAILLSHGFPYNRKKRLPPRRIMYNFVYCLYTHFCTEFSLLLICSLYKDFFTVYICFSVPKNNKFCHSPYLHNINAILLSHHIPVQKKVSARRNSVWRLVFTAHFYTKDVLYLLNKSCECVSVRHVQMVSFLMSEVKMKVLTF